MKIEGSTTTIHITDPYGIELATIEGNGLSTTTVYSHQDHLGSTNVLTTQSGTLKEVADYYPYGAPRVQTTYTGTSEQRKYLSEDYDTDSNLSYLNARYYEGSRGQFLSQDPVHLAVGDESKLMEFTEVSMSEYLKNPQFFNSYSYGLNNPMRFSDPKGLWYGEISGSLGMFPVGGTIGIRFNDTGIVLFGTVGGLLGVEGNVSASYSSGDMNTDQGEVTVSRSGRLAAGAGIGVSREAIYDPTKPLSLGNNRSTSYSTIVGLGGGLVQEYTRTQPLIKFDSGSSNKGSSNKSAPSQTNSSNGGKSSTNSKLISTMSKLISTLKSYVKVLKGK